MIFTLAACGGDGGVKAPAESSAPTESSNPPSGKARADENRYYSIGEAAEANGLSIIIDGAEPFNYTGMLSRSKDGFEYVKVWFTLTNVSGFVNVAPDLRFSFAVE